MLLTRNQILDVDDLKFEDVEVPLWKGTVRVRALTAKERDQFETESQLSKTQDIEVTQRNLRARLVVKCLIDDKGNRLFTDEEAEALGNKHSAVVNQLFWVARRLSAFTEKELDELIKNSTTSPAGADSGASA